MQVGGAVQADGGLSGAGGALDADGLTESGPHDAVLVRLTGGADVTHRAGAGALDLGLHYGGVRRRPSFGQLFVLVRSQLAMREAEAPAQPNTHRLPGSCLVEGP